MLNFLHNYYFYFFINSYVGRSHFKALPPYSDFYESVEHLNNRFTMCTRLSNLVAMETTGKGIWVTIHHSLYQVAIVMQHDPMMVI